MAYKTQYQKCKTLPKPDSIGKLMGYFFNKHLPESTTSYILFLNYILCEVKFYDR